MDKFFAMLPVYGVIFCIAWTITDIVRMIVKFIKLYPTKKKVLKEKAELEKLNEEIKKATKELFTQAGFTEMPEGKGWYKISDLATGQKFVEYHGEYFPSKTLSDLGLKIVTAAYRDKETILFICE